MLKRALGQAIVVLETWLNASEGSLYSQTRNSICFMNKTPEGEDNKDIVVEQCVN